MAMLLGGLGAVSCKEVVAVSQRTRSNPPNGVHSCISATHRKRGLRYAKDRPTAVNLILMVPDSNLSLLRRRVTDVDAFNVRDIHLRHISTSASIALIVSLQAHLASIGMMAT